MAVVLDSIPAFVGYRSAFHSSCSPLSSCSVSVLRWPENGGNGFPRSGGRRTSFGGCRAMVQQTVQGASSAYAKTMERLSAKESLLLALNDSGGIQALITGKTTDMQRIDVNERITSLERLNPTSRPTTSPFFEGRWNVEWLGIASPGLLAARSILEIFPSALANLLGLDVVIKDGFAKTTANVKLLNSIESKFILTTKVSVEGPLRMKIEYVEGVFETPTVREEAVPEQLQGVFGQAVSTLQQLPVPVRDVMSNGLRLPLSGTFEGLFMISYLDEEILIIRDTSGVPDVLTRLDDPPSLMAESTMEYES